MVKRKKLSSIDELYPPITTFMRAIDITEPRKLTIESTEVKEIENRKDGTKSKEGIIHFAGTKDVLVLNRTNYNFLLENYGTSENWTGKKVTVTTEMTSFAGRPVRGIRLALP